MAAPQKPGDFGLYLDLSRIKREGPSFHFASFDAVTIKAIKRQ